MQLMFLFLAKKKIKRKYIDCLKNKRDRVEYIQRKIYLKKTEKKSVKIR